MSVIQIGGILEEALESDLVEGCRGAFNTSLLGSVVLLDVHMARTYVGYVRHTTRISGLTDRRDTFTLPPNLFFWTGMTSLAIATGCQPEKLADGQGAASES